MPRRRSGTPRLCDRRHPHAPQCRPRHPDRRRCAAAAARRGSGICPWRSRRASGNPMRLAAALLLALLAATASAHDLITAETAQAYLARQAQLRKVIDAPGATSSRARAWLELGNMLDEIGALFNGDIDAHGKVQGLPSNVLMAELRARGDALAWSAARKRF